MALQSSLRKITTRVTEEAYELLREEADRRGAIEGTHIPFGSVIIGLAMEHLPKEKKSVSSVTRRKPVSSAVKPPKKAVSRSAVRHLDPVQAAS